MAEQSNGNPPQATEEQVRQQVDDQAKDIAANYERAKREMNDAITRLRAEIDKIDMQRARVQAEDWVKENPALSTFVAVGAGILVGRLLSVAFTPAPPPPLPERVKRQAQALARQAGHYAGEAGTDFAKKALAAGGVIALTAKEVADVVGRRAGDAADTLRDGAVDLGGRLSHRAADWNEVVTTRAGHALDSLHDSAGHFSSAVKKKSKTVRKKTEHGVDLMETMAGAVRTAVAAVLIKKANDWVKKIT